MKAREFALKLLELTEKYGDAEISATNAHVDGISIKLNAECALKEYELSTSVRI